MSHPFINAFVYGLLYGPIALPCSGPLLVSVFALSLTVGEALSKLNIFFWFGIGFGLPLLRAFVRFRRSRRWITRQFAQHARLINLISGILLVGVGIYDLASNWSLLRLFFR